MTDHDDLRQELERERALRQRLERTQQMSGVGIWDLDLATGVYTWSPEMHELFGTDPATFSPGPDDYLQFVVPEDQAALLSWTENLDSSGAGTVQYRVRRTDGAIRMIESRVAMDRDDDGQPIGASGTARDVTNRLEAAEALARADADLAKQSALLTEAEEIGGVGSWSADLVHGTLHWSLQFRRMVQADLAPSFQPTVDDYWAIIHPDDVAMVQESFTHTSVTGEDYRTEHRIMLPSGEIRTFLTIGKAEIEDGAVVRVAGIAHDVTEERRQEQEATQARDLFQQLLSAATDQAIIGVDSDGLVNVFNRGAERMLGYTSEEMLGRQPWSLLRNENDLAQIAQGRDANAVYLEVMRQGAEGGSSRTTLPGVEEDRLWVCKDGRSVMVQTSLTPMRDQDGEITGFLCIATDVTQRRAAELARDRAENEVREAIQELERARDAALAAMAQALRECEISGVATNVEFLGRVIACKDFASGAVDTGLIERNRAELLPEKSETPAIVLALAAFAQVRAEQAAPAQASPWDSRDGWRLNLTAQRNLQFKVGGVEHVVGIEYRREGMAIAAGGAAALAQGTVSGRSVKLSWNGERAQAQLVTDGAKRTLFTNGRRFDLELIDPAAQFDHEEETGGGLTAPMSGKVLSVLVQPGATVEKGAPLLVMEAMKMEHTISAPAKGKVVQIRHGAGEQVAEGVELVAFEPAS